MLLTWEAMEQIGTLIDEALRLETPADILRELRRADGALALLAQEIAKTEPLTLQGVKKFRRRHVEFWGSLKGGRCRCTGPL